MPGGGLYDPSFDLQQWQVLLSPRADGRAAHAWQKDRLKAVNRDAVVPVRSENEHVVGSGQ